MMDKFEERAETTFILSVLSHVVSEVLYPHRDNTNCVSEEEREVLILNHLLPKQCSAHGPLSIFE